jgi:hypothetical protein
VEQLLGQDPLVALDLAVVPRGERAGPLWRAASNSDRVNAAAR